MIQHFPFQTSNQNHFLEFASVILYARFGIRLTGYDNCSLDGSLLHKRKPPPYPSPRQEFNGRIAAPSLIQSSIYTKETVWEAGSLQTCREKVE
jgi:hypothetical protein